MKKKKKSVKKKKKRRVVDVDTPMFWVEIEFPNCRKGFTYSQIGQGLLQKEKADSLADKLRGAGVGGRLLYFDGRLGGRVEKVWGSAARVAAAEQIEKEALTR